MKIKGWIIWGLAALVATASTGLGAEIAPSVQENFNKLETAIAAAKDQVRDTGGSKSSHWAELETFQTSLWRAMALDPSTIAAVPLNQVPKSLYAAELNADLARQLSELKKSNYPKTFHAEAEFSQYVQTVEKILAQRRARQFPIARATAKRGILDSVFIPLNKKFNATADSAGAGVPALAQIEDTTRTIRDQLEMNPRDATKKEVFANGNKFIWYMIAMVIGFFLGLAGYRTHPDFFQKIVNQFQTPAPTATTHSAGNQKLDYARWLREFEEILSRLKSSQMTLERRIENIVQNSEKISQQSLSLYADARIKNEANLEYRVSTLVREVQQQFDQSQKLQAGDRIQINFMLEHCLKLCDAIETNNIHLDQAKLAEPQIIRVA